MEMKYIDLCKKENVSLEDISWIFQKIRSQPLILRAVPFLNENDGW